MMARCWWLTSVILAIQEAEIRKMEVQGLPRISSRDPISKIPNTKKGWWSGSSGTCLAKD
jgi:hypothetical protein